MPAAKPKTPKSSLKNLSARVAKLEQANRALTRLVRKLSADGLALLTPDAEAELDRRIDAFEKGESKSLPWPEVRDRLFKKYGVR